MCGSSIVCDFLPSAYGERTVKLVEREVGFRMKKSEHYASLASRILRERRGTKDPQVLRPVLVFFEDEKNLMAFYESPEAAALREVVTLMSKPFTGDMQEAQAAIEKTMTEGQITLALGANGRGRDTVCHSSRVNDNGGSVVITAGLVRELAEQRQQAGRAGRCGRPGSYGLEVCGEDICTSFGLTKDELQDRMADPSKSQYQILNELRIEKFEKQYHERSLEVTEAVEYYQRASMELRHFLLCTAGKVDEVNHIVELLKHCNPISETVGAVISPPSTPSRLLILLDVTASMGTALEAAKSQMKKSVHIYR